MAMDHATHPPSAPPGPSPRLSGRPPSRFEITHGPSFAMLRIDLEPGEVVRAQAGTMVARHRPVAMSPRLNAGRSSGLFQKVVAFFVALVRKLFGGETFFVNRFEAPGGGSLWLAPRMAGAVAHRRLAGEKLVLTAGCFLATAGDLRVKTRFGGLRSILSSEGAVLLEVSGHGDLWFASYGGIHEVEVDGSYLVDTGHLVAFEGALTLHVRRSGGGALGLLASGEGLVAELRGRGRVYLQSRNLGALVDWLLPLLPR